MTTGTVQEIGQGAAGTLAPARPARRIGRIEKILGPQNYRIIRGLLVTPTSVAGLIILSFFVVVALGAPLIAPPPNPANPYKIPRDGFSTEPKPPMTAWGRTQPPLPFWWKPVMGTDKWVHLMGTSSGQYDIFYGVIWGTRTAFRVGVLIVLATLLIGLAVGAIAAYYGGWVDNLLMRIVDVFLTLPFIMAALILSAVLTPKMGRSLVPAMIAITAFNWMTYARLVRGDILTVKERDFVLAARTIGSTDRHILGTHILPNSIFPSFVYASLDIGNVVLTFAALGFLGVGTEVGYADWGQLLSFARNWITNLATYWYIVVYPGVALVLFVLGWNLVGDALRDVLDPRMRGSR
ncbi:MAG TPA: ABC transporter permease [Anaerolineae bacterium]